MAGCMPPGMSHGPRVRDGMHVAATVATLPTDDDEQLLSAMLSVRLASTERGHGRLGHQFGVAVPIPAITETFDGDDQTPALVLLTGEYYRETDHPNSARAPRGWGVQASLFSLAPYAKIGWYGERAGVHITNGIGVYGGLLGVFPRPEAVVWWPSATLEVEAWPGVSGMFHLGGSVWLDPERMEADYQLMIGATLSAGGF